MKVRKRFEDHKQISKILLRFAKRDGKSFIRYDESREVDKAKLDPPNIERCIELLGQLQAVASNLSFRKSTLRVAFAIVFDEMKEKWHLTDAAKEDWSETMTRRLANMCSTTMAGVRKNSGAPWVQKLPWMPWHHDKEAQDSGQAPQPGQQRESGQAPQPGQKREKKAEARQPPETIDIEEEEEKDNGETEEEKEESKEDDEAEQKEFEVVEEGIKYEYSWNKELKVASRRPLRMGKGRGVPELAVELLAEGDEENFLRARFQDGSIAVLNGITNTEYLQGEQHKRQEGRRDPAAVLWHAEHPETKNNISIRQRKVDKKRSLLLCIFEQGRAVGQTVVGQFGPLPAPQPEFVSQDDATLQKALVFLQPFAEGWVSGKYKDADEVRKATQRANADLRKEARGAAKAERIALQTAKKKTKKQEEQARKAEKKAETKEARKAEKEESEGGKHQKKEKKEKKRKRKSKPPHGVPLGESDEDFEEDGWMPLPPLLFQQ